MWAVNINSGNDKEKKTLISWPTKKNPAKKKQPKADKKETMTKTLSLGHDQISNII